MKCEKLSSCDEEVQSDNLYSKGTGLTIRVTLVTAPGSVDRTNEEIAAFRKFKTIAHENRTGYFFQFRTVFPKEHSSLLH